MSKYTTFNVGLRIRELRIARGLSQEQLALRSNITTTYLGLLERNQKNPTIKVLEQVCQSLNVSLMEFFSDANNSQSPPDIKSMQILAQLDDCSEDEKELILQLIKTTLQFCRKTKDNCNCSVPSQFQCKNP